MSVANRKYLWGTLNVLFFCLYGFFFFVYFGDDLEYNGIFRTLLSVWAIPITGSIYGFCVGHFSKKILWSNMMAALAVINIVAWLAVWPYGRWGMELLVPFFAAFWSMLFFLTYSLAAPLGRTFKNTGGGR